MGEEGHMKNCFDIREFNEQLKKANEEHKLLVVYFHSYWSAPCFSITPSLVELAKSCEPAVTFIKVDAEVLKSIANKYYVEMKPTFVFLKNGKNDAVDKVVGAKIDQLRQKIAQHTSAASTA